MTRQEYLRRGVDITLKEMLLEVLEFLRGYMAIPFQDMSFGPNQFKMHHDDQTMGNGSIAMYRQGQSTATVQYTIYLGRGSIAREHEWCKAEVTVDVPGTGKYLFACHRTSVLSHAKFLKVSR